MTDHQDEHNIISSQSNKTENIARNPGVSSMNNSLTNQNAGSHIVIMDDSGQPLDKSGTCVEMYRVTFRNSILLAYQQFLLFLFFSFKKNSSSHKNVTVSYFFLLKEYQSICIRSFLFLTLSPFRSFFFLSLSLPLTLWFDLFKISCSPSHCFFLFLIILLSLSLSYQCL